MKSAPELGRLGRRLRPLARPLGRALPPLIVIAIGLALTWPLAAGVTPLSADHPVHLTRAWLFGEVLGAGQLRGWSDLWFFGMPVGELYPPLGDLMVVALRALSLGLCGWGACYAWMVAGVFTLQGLALLHAGRTLGRGPLPGLIAAILALIDAGAYREGGWTYTMLYGVWPQALSTSLCLLCLSAAARARESGSPAAAQRRLAWAALAGGAALLAHPMSLPSLAIAAVIGVWVLGRTGPKGQVSSDMSEGTFTGHGSSDRLEDSPTAAPTRTPATRTRLAEGAADLALVALLALGVAAWWLLPMLAHRAWMASYGWLHAPLDLMTRMAIDGRWTQHMPSAVGFAVWLGLLVTLIRGPALARLVGAWALSQWLLASADAFWGLRLDHLSAGFSHVQYQRFLIAAKPGLFLLAGIGVAALPPAIVAVARSRLRAHLRWPLAVTLGGGLILLGGGVIEGSRAAIRAHHVGEVQTARFPERRDRDGDYEALITWLRGRWEGRAGDYRVAFQVHRNAHWFMDSPLRTRTPTYKLGFTPGDNFVHKPEAGGEALFDRLGVRYVVRVGGRGATMTFGDLSVRDRGAAGPCAHLEGPGVVEGLTCTPAAGVVRARIRGADPATTRLVLHIAGYPRWRLTQGGRALEWVEVPAIGEGPEATQEARRRGELRGGKAGGDDGSEPTLIAAPVGDGEVIAEYVRWRWFDVVGLAISIAALAALGVLLRGRRLPLLRLRALAVRALRPALVALAIALVLVGLALRWRRADAAEAGSAHAWLARGQTEVDAPAHTVRAGPLKADMILRPAILLRARGEGTATITFPGVVAPGSIRGRVALDDDAAKERRRGQHRLRIDARPAAGGEWRTLADHRLSHRPGSLELDLDPGILAGAAIDLRLRIFSSGEAPPALGIDLELGAPP